MNKSLHMNEYRYMYPYIVMRLTGDIRPILNSRLSEIYWIDRDVLCSAWASQSYIFLLNNELIKTESFRCRYRGIFNNIQRTIILPKTFF